MKISMIVVVALSCLILSSTATNVLFTCYDFHQSFPDMNIWTQPGTTINALTPGATSYYLEDERPIFANKTEAGFPFTTAENFNQWYRSSEGVNMVVPVTVPFTVNGNRFLFHDNNFWPLDGHGFGNDGEAHNYYFTCRAHFYFVYTPDCTWSLTSDDDMWVYVNGIEVADLGGLHTAGVAQTYLPTSAIQTSVTNALGTPLVEGQTYRVDIFFAERMPTESSLLIDVCNGSAEPVEPVSPPVNPPVNPPVSPPIPVPGGSGDPHIRGFLGQKFDFHGDADKVFNIISDHDVQLNSKIVGADLAPDFRGKTYFGSFGIKIGNDKLYIACDRALNDEDKKKYNGHVLELNGESISDSVKRQFELDGFSLRLNEKRHRITVEHEVYTFNIQFSSSARSSCHLNIRTSIKSQKSIQQATNRKSYDHLCPHGVLGQTVRPTPNTKSDGRNGEGVIEGIYTSYRVAYDKIFGDEFEFNCFNAQNNVLIGEGFSDDQE